MSWKCEVLADSSGVWCSNGLAFATKEEAETYGIDLALRWSAVRDSRAVESDEPVNYRMEGARLIPLKEVA